MKKQSGSIHIVIIVIAVVAIIGLLGFVLWQNFIREDDIKQNQTETTQTDPVVQRYINESVGYSIDIPAEWILEEPKNSDESPIIRNMDPTTSIESQAGYPEGYINIGIYKIVDDENFRAMAKGMSTAEFYEALGTTDINNGAASYDAASVKTITVNGRSAKSAKASFTEVNESIYFLENSNLFQISLTPYGASSDETVREILDSFITL